MVVITECKTVFLCKFSHTVEIFAHAFHAGYGIIYLIARNYEIFSAACFLYFEQFAPTVHDFLLFWRVFLNAWVGRNDFNSVCIANFLELVCRQTEYFRIASPLHKLNLVISHFCKALNRSFRVLVHRSHNCVELETYFLFRHNTLRHGESHYGDCRKEICHYDTATCFE